jgi:ABC-type phosphate/phosphonate transport system substrate-binding protein
MKINFLQTLLLASLPLAIACTGSTEQSSVNAAAQEISIIPMPSKLEKKDGNFIVSEKTKFFAQQNNAEALRIANMLAGKFQKAAGFHVSVSQADGTNIPSMVCKPLTSYFLQK